MWISIHAPRAGCDDSFDVLLTTSRNFNPRTPCGVRLLAAWRRRRGSLFQSTHPVRGATAAISTQSPRRTRFQSTHPVRGATASMPSLSSSTVRFQSTHPVRGATRGGNYCPNCGANFNPRTPCGVRRRQGGAASSVTDFNPRTPCGVRPISIILMTEIATFQSTHPVRGATI